jgi:hypothetical protein
MLENKVLMDSEAVMLKRIEESLVRRHLIADSSIINIDARLQIKKRQEAMYQNTELLLQNYRDIKWALQENIDDSINEEIGSNVVGLSRSYTEELLEEIKPFLASPSESFIYQMQSAAKSACLLRVVDSALKKLQTKYTDGGIYYRVLAYHYIDERIVAFDAFLEEEQMGRTTYFRKRKKAIELLSILLWGAPTKELAAWADIAMIVSGSENQRTIAKSAV